MKTFEYDILSFQVKKQKDYDAMRSALNERGAEGWEVANVMMFLASDYSSYLTGEIISCSSQRA